MIKVSSVSVRSFVSSDICSCGGSLVGVSSIVDNSSLVALFEHVHRSGVPNFKLCRVPIVNSKLNILVLA